MKKLLILSLLVIVGQLTAQAEFTVTAINGKPIPPTPYTNLVGTTSINKSLSPAERNRLRREELHRKLATKPTNNVIIKK
jgi:hypothetical protein